MQHPATTSESLLTRLTQANADPAAWSHFVEVYGLQIVQWCRSYGLQDADAQDLAQDVLVRFWRQARNFQYKPGRYFRGYLHKVARTALWQWKVRLKEGDIGAGGEQMHQRLRLIPAKEDLLARLEQAYDQELLRMAMREVEQRVDPHNWRAFELVVLEKRSGTDAAQILGIEAHAVYVARLRVQRMIRTVLLRLEECT